MPINQSRPAIMCIEANPIEVLKSSDAPKGAAAVTIPNTRPIVGDLDRNPFDFFPIRDAIYAAITRPIKVEANTIGRTISWDPPWFTIIVASAALAIKKIIELIKAINRAPIHEHTKYRIRLIVFTLFSKNPNLYK